MGSSPSEYRTNIEQWEIKKKKHLFSIPMLHWSCLSAGSRNRKGRICSIAAIRNVCRSHWDAKMIVAGDGGMQQ
ncbi:MAG: hypothetical protein WCF90_00390 [Methanomicrobiales archaeon]